MANKKSTTKKKQPANKPANKPETLNALVVPYEDIENLTLRQKRDFFELIKEINYNRTNSGSKALTVSKVLADSV